ncbi:MAG: Maf family nucleotide pyrophosphatase [Bacteroidales bacterium]|jgi:septum formation protein|nr:Maf family nucleotide pyrophosphatase [Bacteroidales bacterium]
MDLKGKKIILSSTSPRRETLLKGLDIDFKVDCRTHFKESYGKDTPIEEIPALMSEGKSKGFHRDLKENEILITADTMVYVDGKVLGKPHDHKASIDMLRELSGKRHKVITAVTIRDNHRSETFTDTSCVFFKDLSEEEIDYYVSKYKPYDKAGSYGIQEWIGYIGITKIEGSFCNIMGLPVHKVYRELQKFIEKT